MQHNDFKIATYVALMLSEGDSVLLSLRPNNVTYEGGLWVCPGGWVEADESIVQAVIREAREELGLQLYQDELELVHVLHIKNKNVGTLCFFFDVSFWEGEPRNMEPHKCDELEWFSIDALPNNVSRMCDGYWKT